MKIEIRSSFVKAVRKLPADVQHKVADIIIEMEVARSTRDIQNCKKLKGYKSAYRIKLDTYRIGFFFEKGALELPTILHRRDIYRYFP